MQATQSISSDLIPLETFILDVRGMKCAGCVKAVETQLTQQPGVQSATVNLVTEVARVDCQPGVVDPQALAQRLTDTGFPSQPRGTQVAIASGEQDAATQQRLALQQQIKQVAIAATLLILSVVGHLDTAGWLHVPGLSNIWFHWGLATVALLVPGRRILVEGWQGLRHNAPNMNTLVGLGTFTAYSTSTVALLFPQLGWECFFDEPVMLVGFILLGRTLEQQARGQAAASFRSLLALQPAVARLVKAGEAESLSERGSIEIPVAQVQIGEWVQVLPGETIPVDGQVVMGQTTVNEAMLTGEALPVLKQVGDSVAAGSLNLSGAIALQATHTGQDSTLAKIIALVEAAQTRKAPIQTLADWVAGYFTYGVMAIALLTFLFWYFIGTSLWGDWVAHPAIMVGHVHGMTHAMTHPAAVPTPLLLSLKLAIAVLVIACPCALGLATPTAILVGSGLGAERGLLIRGGDVLERVHRLQTIVLDKTGTLTLGHPVVTDCLPLADHSVAQILQFAATVEHGTQHPLAIAIQAAAQQQELPLLSADGFRTEPGGGVAAHVLGQSVQLGTADWLSQVGVTILEEDRAERLAAEGKTVVYMAIDGVAVGLIAARDPLRPDAIATVQRLKTMGLRVMMLTGDRLATATAIAQPLGLATADILAGVRPEGKAAAIAQLQAQGQQVAMIGDGINDAPALAQADVGIALRSGTDAAMETAGIILMRDRLGDVVDAIDLSRATFDKIRQNLFWAFIYNIVGIPAAAGVLLPTLGVALSPATAGAFMAFSSVSVVTNSLLLRRRFSVYHRARIGAEGLE